jgi:hypothetical protein
MTLRLKTPATRNRPLLAALFFAVFYVCFFSPVLFAGRVLAPTDSFLFYYPHFNSPFKLWDSLLMTGYPNLADPQLMSWYPLALLLRPIPGSWNTFVLLAYVLASWFMYLFVRKLTGLDFAGIMSGLIFGICGFMSAHLAHTTMIQTAAWIPAILLCVEHLAGGIRWRWLALGGLGVGTCILAGHPQIASYGMTLVVAYIIVRGFSAVPRQSSYYAASGVMFAMGLALSAVQILPTAELAGFTTRARLTYGEFCSFSLPLGQLPSFLFPFLFGGTKPFFLSGVPYFGQWHLAEITGYVGFSGLVLAAIAVISHRSARVLFWMACMVVSLCASMGGATPLGRVLYAAPVFGQFRAQGRFLLIFAISTAILAGYGVAAITERRDPARHRLLVVGASLVPILSAAVVALFLASPLKQAAATVGARQYSASPFGNWWIGVPVLVGCSFCILLWLFIRNPDALTLRTGLVLAVIVELSAFSWYVDWRYASPRLKEFEPPDIVRRNGPNVRLANARWVPVGAMPGRPAEAPADLSVLWQLPSLSKYGPLLPVRYSELMNMETAGQFLGHWWTAENRAIDVAAGRFVAVPADRATTGEFFHGIRFLTQDFTMSVGNGCGAVSGSESVFVRQPHEIRGLALITFTGCSTEFRQGTPLAEVRLQQPNGVSIPLTMRAGIETAEWAAACPAVAPAMRHRAAEIYSRFAVPRNGANCQGQTYAAIFEFPKPAIVSKLDFRWLAPGTGILRIDKVTLLDAKESVSEPLSEHDTWIGDPARWKRLEESDGVEVYENLRALPRVWLTSETKPARPEEIKRAIQTSRLPDGRLYEPGVVALVEEPLQFRTPKPDPDARAWLLEDNGTSAEIRTSSSQPAFLVLGDFYYPGWQATINGRRTHIFRTNYIQRGILLPSGENSVRFEFHPARFYAGAAISLSTLAVMLGVVVFGWRHGRL